MEAQFLYRPFGFKTALLTYTHTELRGAAQVYVKAETGTFVFILKAVQIWTMQPDLYCSDTCLMSNQ